MKLKPLEASIFKKLPEELKTQLTYSGVVAVNDSYLHIWDNQNSINLLFGSYGSGKSVYVSDIMIHKCMNDPYFRCYFGRKVLDKVRGSIFATIKDRLKDLKVDHEFIYSDAPNGSMVIKHRKTGNEFLPFGSDNPQSLKSIKDPTHFICEELDQFSFTDFGFIFSRLRTEKAITQFYGLFNTEMVYEGHWIRKVFWDGEFKDQCAKYKSTFRDNYFINQEDYYNKLKLIANGDPVVLEAIANAEWGILRSGNPWVFNWNRKLISPGLQAISHLPIILSFDFNVEPITCLVGQVDDSRNIVLILDEFRLMNSDIEQLCLHISTNFPDKMFLVTGDASGQARTALRKDLNYYKEIKRCLKLGMGQFKVPAMNPPLKSTRVLCNALLHRHPKYYFSDRVPYLVTDIESCEADDDGGIDKGKDKHKSHLLDCWRYFNWTFLKNFINLPNE